MRFNARAIIVGLVLLVLAGGVVFAGLRFFGDDDAVRVVYLEPEEAGPDPFTDPAVFTADVTPTTTTLAATPTPAPTLSPSPTPTPSPTLTGTPFASPSPTVAASGRRGECDSELLIRLLNERPERKAAWLEVLGVVPEDFEAGVRSLHPAMLTRDALVTNHGFRDGEAYEFHAILARGTAVLVDDEGGLVVRCYSGSPLLPPQEIDDFECEGCPPDYELPPACNGNCFVVVTTTTTTAPVTTTSVETTTTRRVTTTRRPTTTTRRPATTAPPATTLPTTTQPPTMPPTTPTTTPATTSTGISEGTTTTTTTEPPSEN